jgi:hypothetical protein
MKQRLLNLALFSWSLPLSVALGGGLTTRHKGAGVGALGGELRFGCGLLIGDQLQGQEQRQADHQRQIDSNQVELDRQRKELEGLKNKANISHHNIGT